MPRLATLKPRLSAVAPRLGPAPGDVRSRDRERSAIHWRKWYKTSRWIKLRWQVLTRDLFTCQMCGRIEGNTAKLVADHKTPHRGSEALFWDEQNLWCLCSHCHDSVKRREELQHDRRA